MSFKGWFYTFCTDCYIGHHPISRRHQGGQAKQVHCLPEPLADGRTLRLLQPVLRASSELRLGEQPQPGLADVHPGVLWCASSLWGLAQESSPIKWGLLKSAFESIVGTLAWENQHLGVLPDPDRRCELFYCPIDYREYISIWNLLLTRSFYYTADHPSVVIWQSNIWVANFEVIWQCRRKPQIWQRKTFDKMAE